MNKVPNPGSDEAIKRGCTCAVLDNRHGIGADDFGDGYFWITQGCPLHDPEGKVGIKEGDIGGEVERDRIEREVIRLILETVTYGKLLPPTKWKELAKQILNIKGLLIEADNQELPYSIYANLMFESKKKKEIMENYEKNCIYEEAQLDMSDFKRVLHSK